MIINLSDLSCILSILLLPSSEVNIHMIRAVRKLRFNEKVYHFLPLIKGC